MSSILGGLGIGGGAIGKAIVQLELDSKKYAAEMQAAETQTKTSTSKLGSSFKAFGGVASAAFTAAGVAAVAFGAYAVKSAVDAQEAQQRLHNTIKNAPQLAEDAEQAFLDQAEAIRQLTGADDEAIISGEALLGNMGLQKDQILDLAPLVVDLATKYDIDLQSAFKAVGKATTGSTGALARYVGAIEQGATPAETFQNVLNKLGGAAGFAAEQAKNQPWILLKSDFEELAEQVGTALLPAIQGLADVMRNIVPLLKFAADNLDLVAIGLGALAAYKALPALMNTLGISIQGLGGYAAIAATAVGLLVNGLNDMAQTSARADAGLQKLVSETIRNFADEAYASDEALVRFAADFQIASDNALTAQSSLNATQLAVHGLREAFANGTITQGEFADALDVLGLKQDDVSRIIRETTNRADEFRHHIDDAGKRVRNFANMTTKEFEDWSASTKESFDDFVLGLEESAEQTKITRREFIDATRVMQREARQLADAMTKISKEKWVNEEYIAFLSEQGPEWLIGFADLTEKQQRRAQDAWEESTKKTNNAKRSLDDITGVLGDLDKSNTKHTVQIKYEYVGFDPTKPGMSHQQK